MKHTKQVAGVVTSWIPHLSTPVSIYFLTLSLSLSTDWTLFESTLQTSQDNWLGHCCSFPWAMSLKSSLCRTFPPRPREGTALWRRPLLSLQEPDTCWFQAVEKLQAGPVLFVSPRLCGLGGPCAGRNTIRLSCPQHRLPSGLLLVALVDSGSRVSLSSRSPHPRERLFREVQLPLGSCPAGSPFPAGILKGPGPTKGEESFPVVAG